MDSTRFFIGSWQVEPAENSLRQGKRKRTLEPKAMDVLLLLCQHQGEVAAEFELLDVNQDGMLTKTEAMQSQMDLDFSDMDADEDEMITQQEYADYIEELTDE